MSVIISEEGREIKPHIGSSIGALHIGKDGEPEIIITISLNPHHKNYRKFITMLDKTFKQGKGLIKSISGV